MTTPSAPWRIGSRAWLGLVALGFVLWLLIRQSALIFEVLTVLFAGFLLSLAISPLADYLAARRVPRAFAVLVSYVVAAGILVLLVSLLVPVIQVETHHLRRTLPAVLEKALETLRGVPLLQEWLPPGTALGQGLVQGFDGVLRPAFGAVMGASGLVIDLVVILVFAFFFVTDQHLGDRLLFNWIPAAYQVRVRRFTSTLRFRLTRWIWAQFAVAVYFAVAFSAVLALLRVPFAITIGLIGGLLEIIPYFGGFIAFMLAVLSALSVNPILVLWIAILYLIIVETEGHVLAPVLYGRVTGLHPAAVLLAIFVGAKAAGLVGVLLSVPIAVVVATLIDEVEGRLAADKAASSELAVPRSLAAEREES